MVENSKIEWCHHTFNAWLGCVEVSPACDHCYARAWAKRTGNGHLWEGARRRTTPAYWRQPLRWDAEAKAAGERRRVFSLSLGDVFDNVVDPQWRADLFSLIKATQNLDWLLLTKRIGNVPAMLPQPWYVGDWSNVWIGSTIVTQAEADRDIPKLLRVPAAMRFLSMEPLLEEITLGEHFGMWWNTTMHCWEGTGRYVNRKGIDGRSGIHWVIVGGESGAHARPMPAKWASKLREECAAAGAKFFMKQGSAANWLSFKHMPSWPLDLQVREFPEVWP